MYQPVIHGTFGVTFASFYHYVGVHTFLFSQPTEQLLNMPD